MGDSDTYPIITDQTSTNYEFPDVRDMSGNKHTGLARNVEAADVVRDVPRSDFCKYSILFDGSNDYATMGNVFDFEYTDSFSASCWFKTTMTSAGWFVAKMSTTGPSRGWGFGINDSLGKIKFELSNAWDTNTNFIYTDSGFNDGEWHHCVVTWDGNDTPGAGGMHIYVDGADQAVTVIHNTLSATLVTTVDLYVGSRAQDHPSQAFAGNLTEVSIYDEELSSGDVTAIYNSGLPDDLDGYGMPTSMVAWWRVGTIDQADQQARDLVWGSSAETSQINDMSRLQDHATATNTEAGDFTSDTPGGAAQYSADLNDHLYSLRSIDFDGSDDYVTMGDALDFEYNSAYSIVAWAKWTAASDMVVAGKRDATDKGYWLAITSTGKINAGALNTPVTAGANVTTASTGWNDGDWHLLVMTKGTSSAASSWKIYVDGSLEALDPPIWDTLGTNSISNNGPFTISSSNGTNYFFSGKIDEVAVYDKELDSSEVSAIYNSGGPTDLSPLSSAGDLIGWWRMGDGDTYPTLTGQVDGPL